MGQDLICRCDIKAHDLRIVPFLPEPLLIAPPPSVGLPSRGDGLPLFL